MNENLIKRNVENVTVVDKEFSQYSRESPVRVNMYTEVKMPAFFASFWTSLLESP